MLRFIQHGATLTSDLGCQFTKNADGTYNQWQFILENACFALDPTCKPVAVLKPRPTSAICSPTDCTGPYCIHYAFDSVPPPGNPIERQAGRDAAGAALAIRAGNVPFPIPLAQLFGLVPASACPHAPILAVDQNWNFSGHGNTCKMELPLGNPTLHLNGVIFDVRSSISGYVNPKSSSERDLIFNNPTQSIQLSWIDDHNVLLGSEPVSKIMLTDKRATIVGGTTYCVQIDLPKP